MPELNLVAACFAAVRNLSNAYDYRDQLIAAFTKIDFTKLHNTVKKNLDEATAALIASPAIPKYYSKRFEFKTDYWYNKDASITWSNYKDFQEFPERYTRTQEKLIRHCAPCKYRETLASFKQLHEFIVDSSPFVSYRAQRSFSYIAEVSHYYC